MGTKVVRVTFMDGAKMYGSYSTVCDLASTDILQLTAYQESQLQDVADRPDEPAELVILEMARQQIGETTLAEVDDELVQCEVLHYGDVCEFSAWTSTARRSGAVGTITGANHGERYRGDVAAKAYEMNAQLEAAANGARPRRSRLRMFFQQRV